ncbi:MAG: phosphatidylglycerol:prolipoprotein diacylglycerol transferase [Elusimicrobia bacterium]|nr:MAG: phosphatidylglycerol:prolipoprotein diacylglycerol transferase [Elusimicrobiota bacterium]
MHRLLFEWGGTPVASYGVLVSLGYLAGALWLMTQRERMRMSVEAFWMLCYCILFGAVAGAKLGYLLVEWRAFRAEPLEFLADWKTGWVYQRVYNRLYRPGKEYLPVADYFGAALALGHAQDVGCSVLPALRGVPLHPVQLYEAAGSAAIFLALCFQVLPRIRKGALPAGTSFFGYIGAYAALRFVMEAFRGDDRGALLSAALSPSQWFSLAGLAVAVFALRRLKTHRVI